MFSREKKGNEKMKLIKFILGLLSRLNRWLHIRYNCIYCRYKNIQFGKNFQIYNNIYITGARGKIKIGDNFVFTSGDGINPICRNIRGCIFTQHKSSIITIGNNVGISSSSLRVKEKLVIGNNVNIGGNCLIIDTDSHPIDFLARRGEKTNDKKDKYTIVQSAPINIEDDVWIGANTIVLKGVTIGARSVIGAGSVVTKSIPSDCIAAGNPCKVIKYLN